MFVDELLGLCGGLYFVESVELVVEGGEGVVELFGGYGG